MDVSLVIIGAVAACLAYTLIWFFKPLYRSITTVTTVKLQAEFKTDSGKRVPFPNLFQDPDPSLYLSVIVPAYNEQDRMPIMLDETLRFLDQRKRRYPDLSFEVVIVNDGSTDRTEAVAQSYTNANGSDIVRVLNLEKNSGKGAAVQAGMLHARGQYMLMVDADGASRFSDLTELEAAIKSIEKDGQGIAIGSRAHLQAEAIARRHWFRNFLMHGFHMLVSVVAGVTIFDTQCGFKMFSRRAARDLFANLHLMRWAFDVELIFMANRIKIPMIEVAIHWQEIAGSKVSLVDGPITMFRDIVAIQICYLTGLWQIRPWQEIFSLALRMK